MNREWTLHSVCCFLLFCFGFYFVWEQKKTFCWYCLHSIVIYIYIFFVIQFETQISKFSRPGEEWWSSSNKFEWFSNWIFWFFPILGGVTVRRKLNQTVTLPHRSSCWAFIELPTKLKWSQVSPVTRSWFISTEPTVLSSVYLFVWGSIFNFYKVLGWPRKIFNFDLIALLKWECVCREIFFLKMHVINQ